MSTPEIEHEQGVIAWMARNPVVANLLMIIFLVGGIFAALYIQKEVFPEFELDVITINVGYPGASPSEVETGIIQPIEEAVRGIEGIRETTGSAWEGWGGVSVELIAGTDRMKAYQDVDQAVARIRTFPEEADEPEVTLRQRRRSAMVLGLYGPIDIWNLRMLAERLRDRLLNDPNMTLVELGNVPDYITHVEVSSEALREYGLSLPDIAQVIRNSSQDIPAGAVRTFDGEILLRMQERKVWAAQFAAIDLVVGEGGAVVKLGDIASIRDGFEEDNFHSRFNGVPSVEIDIFRTGNESPLDIQKAALEIMADFEQSLPPGVQWRIDSDNAADFRERLSLIVENGLASVLIVLAILSLFLAGRLAFWVMVGMAVAYIGSVMFLPLVGVSINMVSLFGFLVALGLVVDDAIVVGENVFEERKKQNTPLAAAIAGAQYVSMPVLISILTTVIAFVPLLFMPGETGLFWWPLPVVVIVVLLLSLFEALFILPNHLGHVRRQGLNNGLLNRIRQVQQGFALYFDRFVQGPYRYLLNLALRCRYITILLGLSVLAVTGSYANSKHMGMVNMPEVAADEIEAGVRMPVGTTPAQAGKLALKLTEATQRMYDKHNLQRVAEGIKTNVRGQDFIDIEIVLKPPAERDMSAREVIALWREEIGEVQGVDQITFEAERGPGGWRPDISVALSHTNTDILEKASKRLVAELERFTNTADISDSYNKGKKRLDFRLLPEGRALGLTPEMVGSKLRGAFFGALAVRQLRGLNETEVRVKLPQLEREALSYLEDLVIRTPSGVEVPLFEVTEFELTDAFVSINRRNGKRVVTVSTDVEPKREIVQVADALNEEVLPQLRGEFPGLSWQFLGSNAEMRESTEQLYGYFGLAILVIFALLAALFGNYSQPLVVLSAIPFGIIGAVIGHVIMGYDISLISKMGFVALSGVVLNASLLMVDYANRLRTESGGEMQPFEAIEQSGLRRFRPIVLTTLTTFGGLTPILLETSLQAQYLIPMAISLGFGIIFATAIILILVPCLYLALEDIRALFDKGLSN